MGMENHVLVPHCGTATGVMALKALWEMRFVFMRDAGVRFSDGGDRLGTASPGNLFPKQQG